MCIYVCVIMGGVCILVHLCDSCIIILCGVMSYVASGVVGDVFVCVLWCFIYYMCFIHFVWC